MLATSNSVALSEVVDGTSWPAKMLAWTAPGWSIRKTREDLVDYHQTWVRPENATLIVVGDTTLEEIMPLLEQHLGDWSGIGCSGGGHDWPA